MTDAELFTDEPAPAADLFTDEPAPTSRSVGGFAKNVGNEALGYTKALAGTTKTMFDPANIMESVAVGSLDPTKQKLSQDFNAFKAIPGQLVDEAKRIGVGELATGHPLTAIQKFGGAMYDKPITTALDVLPLAGAARSALGARGAATAGLELAPEAAEAGEVAAQAGPASADIPNLAKPTAPAPINLPDEAANILKEIPTPPSSKQTASTPPPEESIPMGATFQETVQNLKNKIPGEFQQPLDDVKSFIEQKYGRMAEKPGLNDVMGDAMIRRAQGMRFRELGGTPGQARKLVEHIGEDGLRELMDIAKEKGITKSPIGAVRRAVTEQLEKSSGQAIGGIRELAAKRGAIHNPDVLVDAIRERLDPKFLGKGTASGEKGAYMKALEDIREHASTPDVLAKKLTDMNKSVTKNKMFQPTEAMTDVANEASRLNNDLVRNHLSKAESNFYDKSLGDFGAAKIFKKLHSFEIGREMGGRAGVGGLWRNIKQGAMDMGGSKVMENFYDRFGPRLKSNPNLPKNLANLSEGAIEDLLSSLDDAIDEVVSK